MENPAPPLLNENLLNSVMSELKSRSTVSSNDETTNTDIVKNSPVKRKPIPPSPPPKSLPLRLPKDHAPQSQSRCQPPPLPPKEAKPKNRIPAREINQKRQEQSFSDPERDCNGFSEYSTYAKTAGQSSAVQMDHNLSVSATSLEVPEHRKKSLSPPKKPIRRNKPVHATRLIKPATINGGSRISSDLHHFIESAFTSISDQASSLDSRQRSKTSPRIGSPDLELTKSGYSTNSNTLKPGDFDLSFKHSLESLDSGLEGSSKSTKPVEEFIDDCFESVAVFEAHQGPPDNHSIDWESGQSDEGHHSNGSIDNMKALDEDCGDYMSISSVEGVEEMKFLGKKLKARERARQLRKQALAQRERVSALLDAAATNASDRIKRFRRPSLKFSAGTKLQNLANIIGTNKHRDDNSSSFSNHNNGSCSENDDDKPSTRKTSLTASHDSNESAKIDHKMAIKTGYLKKQGGKIKTWHERWFVLKGEQMDYYKDRNGKYLSSIFLTGARVVTYPPRTNSNDTHKYLFEIFPEANRLKSNSNHESYVLSASSPADMEEWVKAIRRVILSPFGGGIFGQRLDETMRYDRRLHTSGSRSRKSSTSSRTHGGQVPIIVENCVEFIRSNNGLKEEGLFRLPGQANEVKELQDIYDMGERPAIPRKTDVHTVASLLKGYLRELPEPVISFDLYEPLIDAAKLAQNCENSSKSNDEAPKEKEEAMRIIKDQLRFLPQPNFDLLNYLCCFLDEVQRHSASNKMDIFNLALVFGPNMMRAKKEDASRMMADSIHVQNIIYLLIENRDYFFQNVSKTTNSIIAEENICDVNESQDPGIGTLTTTASPRGTLAMRHANDDSGTGSLAPTPENTNERSSLRTSSSSPDLEACKPLKPKKPLRPNAAQHDGRHDPSNDSRKSYYDNVAILPAADREFDSPHGEARQEWRNSKEMKGMMSNSSSYSVSQESYYVNNRSTPSSQSLQSSTHAVAGSLEVPRSYPSTTTENLSNSQSHGPSRLLRRQKMLRRPATNPSDEESNTESVTTDERAFSSISSHRSSYQQCPETLDVSGYPRTSSCPILKYPVNSNIANLTKDNRSVSNGSGSDGNSTASSPPLAPERSQRRLRAEQAQHDPNTMHPPASTRSSNLTSLGTSLSSRPLTYKEMEDQILALKEEISKQRLEHEKRSRMLEDHYIIKMRGSSSRFPSPNSPDVYPSSSGFAYNPSFSSMKETENLHSPNSENIPLRGMSGTEDSPLDPPDSLFCTPSGVSRAMSNESQSEMRYREELKRHAITKIRLRNAERGLQQAEERNVQLQKEMENFFETFGSMLSQYSS